MSRVELTKALDRAGEMLLEHEMRFFHQHERDWAARHAGSFVLIGKGTFGGFHTTYEDAMRAGIRAFGPVAPFLIRRIGSKA